MRPWPQPVSDEQAVYFALSSIASWSLWCETGGPSLADATKLVMRRIAEAREAREVEDANLAAEAAERFSCDPEDDTDG